MIAYIDFRTWIHPLPCLFTKLDDLIDANYDNSKLATVADGNVEESLDGRLATAFHTLACSKSTQPMSPL